MRFHLSAALAAGVALSFSASAALATDLEVTHWWTSGGEAAAVAELAKAFDASGDKWVDGAIAGGGGTARPIMISRITGGDPMGATQFNHGQSVDHGQPCSTVDFCANASPTPSIDIHQKANRPSGAITIGR